MKEMYICYKGVDGDITYHNTEEEALAMLKGYIDNGLNDGEWMEGVSDSFVAEITHYIKERKIDAPEDYTQEGVSKFLEMNITEISDEIMTTKTLKEIRQGLGYGENDDTHDEEIMKMTLDDKMDAILGWHLGYRIWWSSVKNWMKECGHKFDE